MPTSVQWPLITLPDSFGQVFLTQSIAMSASAHTPGRLAECSRCRQTKTGAAAIAASCQLALGSLQHVVQGALDLLALNHPAKAH